MWRTLVSKVENFSSVEVGEETEARVFYCPIQLSNGGFGGAVAESRAVEAGIVAFTSLRVHLFV